MPYRLKKIIIDGTHYTNPEKIIHSLNFSEDENIFDANLLQISRILEKNTWIESSSIKIKHPGILHISINEKIMTNQKEKEYRHLEYGM